MRAIKAQAFAIAASCALATAGSARADVMGLWQVPGNAILVKIAPCGAALCGTLLNSNRLTADPNARDEKNKNPALRSRPLRGITMLQGFKGGPAAWTGGSIYLPGSGETYRASLTLDDADTLSLKGRQGPFCKTQVFKRAK
jgi:uncharacterized protein (DUF2147 family)